MLSLLQGACTASPDHFEPKYCGTVWINRISHSIQMVFPNSNDFLPPKKRSNPGYSKQITHIHHFTSGNFPWKIAPVGCWISTYYPPLSGYVKKGLILKAPKIPEVVTSCFLPIRVSTHVSYTYLWGLRTQKPEEGNEALLSGFPYEKYHNLRWVTIKYIPPNFS